VILAALTIVLIFGSAFAVVLAAAALTGFVIPLAATLIYLAYMAILIIHAYPPSRRRWLLWIVGTVLLGFAPLLWLTWLAISKVRWAEPAAPLPAPTPPG
jgi:hypothetical protein